MVVEIYQIAWAIALVVVPLCTALQIDFIRPKVYIESMDRVRSLAVLTSINQ